jgi:hypothetical protein
MCPRKILCAVARPGCIRPLVNNVICPAVDGMLVVSQNANCGPLGHVRFTPRLRKQLGIDRTI